MDQFLALSCIIYNGLSLAILQYKGNFERFIEILPSFGIGKAKTTVSTFKKLPKKLSIPAAFSGLVSLSNLELHPPKLVKK